MPARRAFTIGHSTRAFAALLERHGVRRIAGVRRLPGSRRHPPVNREARATVEPAAVMCAEALWWQCYRRRVEYPAAQLRLA